MGRKGRRGTSGEESIPRELPDQAPLGAKLGLHRAGIQLSDLAEALQAKKSEAALAFVADRQMRRSVGAKKTPGLIRQNDPGLFFWRCQCGDTGDKLVGTGGGPHVKGFFRLWSGGKSLEPPLPRRFHHAL